MVKRTASEGVRAANEVTGTHSFAMADPSLGLA
jgi:hypothetical protein